MDPIETLRMLRTNARIINILAQVDDPTDAQRNEILDQAERMAESFADLDSWLVKGGFSPWPEVTKPVIVPERTLADAIPFWDDWLPSTLRGREH